MKLIPKLVFLAILVAAILSITLVWGLITDISLVDPADNAWVNTTSPQFVFRAISDTDSTFSCSLWIDGSNFASNGSVMNNTDTLLIPLLAPLSQGSHTWYIACTDSDPIIVSSNNRTINVDTEAPNIILLEPDNGHKFKNKNIDFQFKVEDNLDDELFCELYVDGDLEEDGNVDNDTAVTWTVNDLSRDTHDWYVSCEDESGNTGTSLIWSFEIEEIGYCKYGEEGNYLDLILEEPDSGDSFYVGEEITVKIEVENNANEDLDVVVEAELYDLDEDDSIIDEEIEIEIGEDDKETVTLKLRVPSTVDEDNDFVVNVKAYEDDYEDEQCKEDSVNVKIKKKSHDITIKDLTLSPDTVPCGDSFNINLAIENTGKHDEDVKIFIYNSILKLDFTRTLVLNEGEDYTTSLLFDVPKDIQEGDYFIDVIVYYDYYDDSYHESNTEDLMLKVEGNCPPPAAPDVSFTLSKIGGVFSGMDFTTKVTITNIGNIRTTYNIEAADYEEWASLVKTSPEMITLDAREVGYAYITLKPSEEAYGMYSFKVKVSYNTTTKEETMSVEVKRRSEAASVWEQFWFEVRRNWIWALFNIALIVVIIILIVYLVKQKKPKTKARPSEIGVRALQPEWKPKTKRGKKKR